MKKILIPLMVLLNSCQNISLGRTPNSFDYKFNATDTCAQIDTTLSELNSHPNYQYDQNELSIWLPGLKNEIKGVALVAHGLNLKPSKMSALANILIKDGIEVLRVSLAGHKGSKREGLFTTHRTWRNEFQAHYCLASKKAKALKVPFYFLGFSLGALVGVDFLNTQNQHEISKMVLISPATDVHWYSKIPGKLSWLSGKISLPSKNLKEYRSQPSTSLASYSSMQESQKSLEEINQNMNIPTLIFVDPDDELVSLKKINQRIDKFKLDNWKVKEINNKDSTLEKTYHHLAVDEASLGTQQWQIIKENIKNHFKQ